MLEEKISLFPRRKSNVNDRYTAVDGEYEGGLMLPADEQVSADNSVSLSTSLMERSFQLREPEEETVAKTVSAYANAKAVAEPILKCAKTANFKIETHHDASAQQIFVI